MDYELTHGGDWAGYEIEYGREALDFSMNVNPLGIPPQVGQAIAKAGQSAHRYPDPLCRSLRAKLSGREKVPAEWIFCGNGAADLIFRLSLALKPEGTKAGPEKPVLLVTAPTFSEYENSFSSNGWSVRRFPLEEREGFRITEPFLDGIGPETEAVFLCEPNNPTGVSTDPGLLRRILEKCRRTRTMLVIDECFNGFLEEPETHSMKEELGGGGLIILKAFTKIFGMAGVRLGYCLCAEEELIGKIRAAGPPWNVSSLAQEAGEAALDAGEHVRKGLAIVHKERPWLKEELRRAGVTGIYGEANYLLFQSRPGLDESLRKRGILIRGCGNYPGLSPGWYRIAVRTHDENRQLMEALREELR